MGVDEEKDEDVIISLVAINRLLVVNVDVDIDVCLEINESEYVKIM